MKSKGEGKTMVSKKMKWVGLVGLVVSAFSLVTHFLLARHTYGGAVTEYQQSSVTIFSWRPIFDNADLPKAVILLESHQRSVLCLLLVSCLC